jgi:hypothetical protein
VSTRRTRRPDSVTLVKDLISFSLGLALIVHQALFVRPADFNPYRSSSRDAEAEK